MGDLLLNINQKIEILDNNTTFRSTIQDINSEGIMIDIPFSGDKYFLMHRGATIDFFVSTDKDITKCRSIVMGRKIENNIQLIILSKPQVIERIQRREYFRLPLSMEIYYTVLPLKGAYNSLSDVPEGYLKKLDKAYTIDISGGGLKMVAKQNLLRGQRVVISMKIPDEIRVLCSVIRSEVYENSSNHKVALKYEGLEEKNRDKIIGFIFEKLREQKRLLG